jgi:GNAT superfamily N-acetyltransferase
MTIVYRRSGPEDTPHIREFWSQHWGDDFVVAHREIYRPENVMGFIAHEQGQWVGLVTYVLGETGCEIVSLDSLREGYGIGSRLIDEVAAEARRVGCKRLFLTTTNDNLHALGFYQKRGFVLAALHRGALEYSRRVKPSISLIGMHGIPLRDEIELEMGLS